MLLPVLANSETIKQELYVPENSKDELGVNLFAYGKKLSIIQGATSYHTTQIAVLVSTNSKFSYTLIDSSGINYKGHLSRKSRSNSKSAVDQISFTELPSATDFIFEVRDQSNDLIDQRTLKTFNESQKDIKIALASCMSDMIIFNTKKIWEGLRQENPDVIFFLGDNVYAGHNEQVSPEKMWDRYVETRSALGIFKSPNLIPIFATWDDHDFGQNNGDKSYAYIPEAQQIFRDFFPQDILDSTLHAGIGIGQSLTLFGRKFLFLDDRSFRDAPNGESMWGAEQEAWLSKHLINAKTPVWIINGSQIFGKYGPSESLEKDFPKQFDRLTHFLKSINTPLTFISGDIHASEVMKISFEIIGQEALEITSSSMHSLRNPFDSLKENPRRVAGFYGDNFINVMIDAFQDERSMHLESFDTDHVKVFELNRSEVTPF